MAPNQRNFGYYQHGPAYHQQGPSPRKALPYHPLPQKEEQDAIFIGIALFYVMTFFVVPAMRAYLISMNIAVGSNSDFKELLDIFKREMLRNYKFLRVSLSMAEMKHLVDLRNRVNHDDLPDILSNWKRDFAILRRLCLGMQDNKTEINVHTVFNALSNGNFNRATYFRFFFPTRWNAHDPYVALCLTHIIYVVLIKYLAKNLWRFLLSITTTASSQNPPIDLFSNLKFIIAKQLVHANYISNKGTKEKDRETLSNCFWTRNSNRHGKLRETELNWELFLESIIKLLERIKEFDDARTVRSILTKLSKGKKKRNGSSLRTSI